MTNMISGNPIYHPFQRIPFFGISATAGAHLLHVDRALQLDEDQLIRLTLDHRNHRDILFATGNIFMNI